MPGGNRPPKSPARGTALGGSRRGRCVIYFVGGTTRNLVGGKSQATGCQWRGQILADPNILNKQDRVPTGGIGARSCHVRPQSLDHALPADGSRPADGYSTSSTNEMRSTNSWVSTTGEPGPDESERRLRHNGRSARIRVQVPVPKEVSSCLSPSPWCAPIRAKPGWSRPQPPDSTCSPQTAPSWPCGSTANFVTWPGNWLPRTRSKRSPSTHRTA